MRFPDLLAQVLKQRRDFESLQRTVRQLQRDLNETLQILAEITPAGDWKMVLQNVSRETQLEIDEFLKDES